MRSVIPLRAARLTMVLGAFLLAGCRDTSAPKAAAVSGFVTSLGASRLWLADAPLPGSYGHADRIVDVNGAPIFLDRGHGAIERGTLADIHAGSSLRVWTTGAVVRTLPPQYVATRIDVVFGEQR